MEWHCPTLQKIFVKTRRSCSILEHFLISTSWFERWHLRQCIAGLKQCAMSTRPRQPLGKEFDMKSAKVFGQAGSASKPGIHSEGT